MWRCVIINFGFSFIFHHLAPDGQIMGKNVKNGGKRAGQGRNKSHLGLYKMMKNELKSITETFKAYRKMITEILRADKIE